MWLDNIGGGRDAALQRKFRVLFKIGHFLCRQIKMDMNPAVSEVHLLPFQPWNAFLGNTSLSSNPRQVQQPGVYRPEKKRGGDKGNCGPAEDHAHDTKYMSRHLKPT